MTDPTLCSGQGTEEGVAEPIPPALSKVEGSTPRGSRPGQKKEDRIDISHN